MCPHLCMHVYQPKDGKGALKEYRSCRQHHKKITKSPSSLMKGILPI